MPRHIAFLRAVNVGGRTVRMTELKTIFEGLGLARVETFLASGNVVFESRSGAAALERKIERALEAALRFDVPAFLRTAAEVASVAAHEAFPEPDVARARVLYVAFLRSAPGPGAAKKLAAHENGLESFRVHGREVYWLSQAGQAESKFSNGVLEKTLGIASTIRGITTVRKLSAKYPPAPPRR